MSMDVGGAKGGVKADINVTPLVDVMLVLLIIMMLVAPMIQQGISINLPIAANRVDKPETQDQTVVAISASREVYLNAEPVVKGTLAKKVTEDLEDKTEKVVLMKADRAVDYGTVMQVMDELREAGIENLGLITDPVAQTAASASGGR